MKIRKITPWIVEAGRQYIFVQVETDEGVTGWGEVTGTGALPNRAVAAVLREMGPFLEGQDASRIEAIWHKVFRAMTYVGTRGVNDVFITEPLDTRAGKLYVPKKPGLGLEMNVDYLKAHAEPGWGG